MENKPTLSIIGLGKLGASMVATFASRGFKVIGVDVKADFVRLVNEGKAPVSETRLAEFISANKERILATQNYQEAVLNSEITFIIVPTPSNEQGGFSLEYVIEAAKEIGQVLKKKTGFHLVVLTSTVLPGATEGELLPVLEKYSEKKCGQDFGLCYNPEFIALGNIIDGLLNPDFVLIGESDKKSGEILESFYKNLCENNPPIKKMSIINAEITKIALNTYVTTKISYANMIAELCEKIPGGNVDVVTDALGCDTRIGHKYLKGGLGYSGPCFPRDNRALISTAEKFGVYFSIAKTTDEINKRQVPRIIEKILKFLPSNGKITILGLSYKTNTNVIEESQAIEIAKILAEKGIQVSVYDPVALENAKKVLNRVIFVNSLKEAVLNADLILITTSWSEFKNIEPDWFKKGKGKIKIIDCWRFLDPEKYKEVADYIPLGINRS